MSSIGSQSAPVDILSPGKKKIAISRKKSDTEEMEETMRRRQQESFKRKQAINASLGKWDTPYDGQNQPSSKKSQDGAPLSERKRVRRRSMEIVSPSNETKKEPTMASRARSASPGALRRKADRERSSMRKRVGSRQTQGRSNSRDKPKSNSGSGKLGKLLNNIQGNRRATGGNRSVSSAPSELQPAHDEHSTSRPARRGSRGTKSSGTLGARKPRRSKSSDLSGASGDKTAPKKMKRRAKSVDAQEAASTTQRRNRRKKKTPTKKKSDDNDVSDDSSADTQEEIQSDYEREDHEIEPKPERRGTRQGHRSRRSMTADTKTKPKKRSASAGPLQRNKEVGDDESDSRPMRANTMMLNRYNTRGGKSNSLGNLVQYAEEEIHSTSYFASNHVLVNRERMKRGLRPLTRNIAMDNLARESAQAMADSAGCSQLKTTYVGNVLRGESIRAVHRATMLNKEGRERHNLLNPYFQDFGVGTAKGDDGMLYVCQLFSERLELQCTDVAQDDSD